MKKTGNINTAVEFMKQIANDDSHGYDQANRNGPDYDCSSLVGTALNKAGYNVSKYSTTRTLEKQLQKEGFFHCIAPWKAGDIHLKTGVHVCMSVDPKNVAHARINEKGTVTGGKTGDQTGQEIAITPYYENGWDVHLRAPEYVSPPKLSLTEIALKVIDGQYGSGQERISKLRAEGYNYHKVQLRVNSLLGYSGIREIAQEVIDGDWGSGEARKISLEKAGYNYQEVQDFVNQLYGDGENF